MVLAHAFGASFVEAAITALGVAYLQKSRPDILHLRAGRAEAPKSAAQSAGARLSLWAVAGVSAAICLPLALIAGFIMGRGHIGHLFGVDWSQVDWRDVGRLLLIVLAANVILLPLAYFASPRRWRKLATWMVGIALWTPIGLITPGIAYAEYVPAAGDKEIPGVGYVPSGLASLSGHYHALLPAYNFPWISGNDPVSKQALGYMLSGFVGMAVLMLLGVLLYLIVRRHVPKRTREDDWRTAT
jgi:multisubunit Na+/H+ antiporter MnhB subunit